MLDIRKRNLVLFLLSLILLAGVLFAIFAAENIRTNAAVEVVEDLPEHAELSHVDYLQMIRYNGQPVALDVKTNTIYISCRPDTNATVSDAAGPFSLLLPSSYHSYFVKSTDDLSEAIRKGTIFDLLIMDPQNKCTEYHVIFTGFPVINIESAMPEPAELKGDRSANLKDEMDDSGAFQLTEPYDPASGNGRVWQSYATWHVRGASSRELDKKPWKLNLKKMNGSSVKMGLLDMPADKGWALNPMNKEDTKIREMLFMTLWNEMADESPDACRMSTGEYTEVLMNGQYMGIYLLQRIIDRQYLGLDEDCILLKGGQAFLEELEQCYEIRYTPLDPKSTYDLIKPVWEQSDLTAVSVRNLITTNLFLQFAAAPDNTSYFNAYFVFRPDGDGYKLEFIPWDTDMSFGLGWNQDPSRINYFSYDPQYYLTIRAERDETAGVREMYSDFDQQTSDMYKKLRLTILSNEHVLETVDSLENELINSGALQRDIMRWDRIYEGEDSVENLKKFILDRFSVLDALYLPQ